MLVYAEGDTPALEKEAQHILFNVLYKAYPGHPWWVRAYPGGFFIKHMDFPGNWGMNAPRHNTKMYSSSAYEKLVVMMAGEWLERANIRRGRYEDGQETKRVEGVPENYRQANYMENPKIIMPDEVKSG